MKDNEDQLKKEKESCDTAISALREELDMIKIKEELDIMTITHEV